MQPVAAVRLAVLVAEVVVMLKTAVAAVHQQACLLLERIMADPLNMERVQVEGEGPNQLALPGALEALVELAIGLPPAAAVPAGCRLGLTEPLEPQAEQELCAELVAAAALVGTTPELEELEATVVSRVEVAAVEVVGIQELVD